MNFRTWRRSDSAAKRYISGLLCGDMHVVFTEEPMFGQRVKYASDWQLKAGPVVESVEHVVLKGQPTLFVYTVGGPCYIGQVNSQLPGVIAERDNARRVAQETERQHVYATNTGMGQCAQCGSCNITEFRVDAGGGVGGMQETACCLSCLFLPLILLVPFLGRRPVYETHRRCCSCGHQWRV